MHFTAACKQITFLLLLLVIKSRGDEYDGYFVVYDVVSASLV